MAQSNLSIHGWLLQISGRMASLERCTACIPVILALYLANFKVTELKLVWSAVAKYVIMCEHIKLNPQCWILCWVDFFFLKNSVNIIFSDQVRSFLSEYFIIFLYCHINQILRYLFGCMYICRWNNNLPRHVLCSWLDSPCILAV